MSNDEDSVHLLEEPCPSPERPEVDYEEGFQHDNNLFEKKKRCHGGGRKKADDWQHVTISQSQSSDGFGKLKFTVTSFALTCANGVLSASFDSLL